MFFDDYIVYANILFAKFQSMQISLIFKIDAPIVDMIIDDIFFNTDNHANTSYANALNLFKRNNNIDRYKITRENSLQFDLIIDFIATNLSFHQIESVLNIFKIHIDLAKIDCINDTEIVNNARVLCDINLYMISQILNSSCT